MIYANEGGRERAVPSRYRGYFSGPTENSYTRRSQIGCLFQHLSGRFLSRWIGELQTKFLSGSPTGGQAPQVDRQAPSCSHNEPSFAAPVRGAIPSLMNLARAARCIRAQPSRLEVTPHASEASPGTGGLVRETRTSYLKSDFTNPRVERQTPVPGTSHRAAGICER